MVKNNNMSVFLCIPCQQSRSCQGDKTWCPRRPACCAPAPVCDCWARFPCGEPPLMESYSSLLSVTEGNNQKEKKQKWKKERNQFYRTHSPYLIFQAWNSNSSREMLAQLATARAATAAISSSFILIDSTSRNGKEILCDLQETTQVDVNCFTSTSLLKSHDVGCHMHATTGSALFLSFFNLKPLKLFPISSVCFFFVSMHMQ